MEVAVVGGGLAGLAVAAELVDGGADVQLLEGRSQVGDGHSGRCLGLVRTGLTEHPHRLLAAMGAVGGREVVAFTQWNRMLLAEMGMLRPVGHLAASLGDREGAEMEASMMAAEILGMEVEAWDAERVVRVTGSSALGAGRFTPGDGVVSVDEVFARLTERVGPDRIQANCRVVNLDDGPDGVRLETTTGTRQAEVVVLAIGAAAPALHGFLREAVTPVRTQWRRVGTDQKRAGLPGFGAQHGHLAWRCTEDALTVEGCRWATPHMEVGETDDTVIVPEIDQRLMDFATGPLGSQVGHANTEAWTSIMAHTCDGLPLIGPLPGQVRLIACLGWNGRPWSFALAAARAVANGLLYQDQGEIPDCFRPARLA